jgi:hypothetical protein
MVVYVAKGGSMSAIAAVEGPHMVLTNYLSFLMSAGQARGKESCNQNLNGK